MATGKQQGESEPLRIAMSGSFDMVVITWHVPEEIVAGQKRVSRALTKCVVVAGRASSSFGSASGGACLVDALPIAFP